MKRTVVAMIVCLSLVSQLGVSADARSVPEIRGTKCAKVGVSRTVKKVVYSCTKSGRSSVWKAVTTTTIAATTTTTTIAATTTTTTIAATTTTTTIPATTTTTTTTVPVSKRISLVRTLPSYDFDSGRLPDIYASTYTNNPGFEYSHQVKPVIGQSFVFDRAMTLKSLVFLALHFTKVNDIDVYYRTPEPANHEMETTDRQTKFPMRLHLTLSKSRSDTPLLNDIEMTRDVVQLYTQTFDQVITPRQPVELVFDTPLAVEPGSYLVTIRLEALTEWVKRQIVTVWFAGQQSGNATRGTYYRTVENNCTYTQGADIYPNGRAYKAEHVEPYVDWQSSPSRTIQTLLTEHRARVQECIRIGIYHNIFNEGDLIMEWRGTWR